MPKTRETLQQKAVTRLRDGARALELKRKAEAQGIPLTIKLIAKRMGMSDTYVGSAMRAVERLGL